MPRSSSSSPGFPPNPFLQLTPLRSQHALERVRGLIWRDFVTLPVEATRPSPRYLPWSAARRLKRRAAPAGEAWGRLFDQRWSRLSLPSAAATPPRWLRWEEDGEATLYLQGVPFYGFDVAHRTCALPAGAREAWVESIAVQAAIWHPEARGLPPEGNRFRGASLGRRDEEAWAAYHDLLCLHELLMEERAKAFPELGRDLSPMQTQTRPDRAPPFLRRLLRGLDEAVDALDTAGLKAMRRRLAALYRELHAERPLMRAALTGHAHVDLVWLWPERVGEVKATHTFANVHYLLGRYPELRFAYSQPASYEAVGRLSPPLLARTRRQIAAGRWEATGALYVESDSHIASGEGLARSFALGQAGFRALSGRHSRLLWLPDLFGFSACLPQLMRQAGVDYFFTAKLKWNALHLFPYSSFVWRGVDGSEVIASVQESGFNNAVTASELSAASDYHAQADIHPETLLPCGYGDGGGGPTDEMCERTRRFSALGPLPELAWDQPERFFDRLARHRRRLPVHAGEIYLEAHRGIFTTRRRLKQAFRRLEQALQLREAVACARRETVDLTSAWQRMVFAQFHDYIPGSSIPDVYEEGLPELEKLATSLTQAASRSLRGSSAKGEPCVFNPLPLARQAVVGSQVVELPPLSGVRISDAILPNPPSAVVAKGRSLDNGLVSARLDREGHLASLVFNGKKVILAGPAGVLMLFPDQPAHHPAWEIDRASLSLGKKAGGPATITARDGTLTVRRKLGRHSEAVLRYGLEPGLTVLRLTVELDWQEPDTLLKLHFPTDYRGSNVRCGLPFGSLLRPQQPCHTLAAAQWEFPASRYVAVADDTESDGLSLITESHYGFSCLEGDLAVSLVRSPLHVGADHYRPAYPPSLRPSQPCLHTDIGRHSLQLALAPYFADAPIPMQPAALAESLFTPVVTYTGQPCATPFQGLTDAETLVPSWLQPLGRDRYLLRLHETMGRRGRAGLRLAEGWQAQRADLFGQPVSDQRVARTLAYKPYEIVNLVISGKR